jgi:hypothetical protein
MGSRRFFTHFLRAKGLTWPQNPSLSEGIALAGEDGCCEVAAGGVLCGSLVCCATAGTTNAEARRATAHWPGKSFETWNRFVILFFASLMLHSQGICESFSMRLALDRARSVPKGRGDCDGDNLSRKLI